MADIITGAGLFFRLFIESNAAFALTDGNGAVLMVNGECDRLIKSLALPPDRSLETLFRNIPQMAEYPPVSGPDNQDTFVFPLRDGNGQNRHLRITLWRIDRDPSALPPEQGPFLGVHIQDITGEWREEERLKADVHQAEQALVAKNLFLANMSHEIRTPIQTITGMTELLQGTRLDQEQAEYSRQIAFSAEVLLGLINDILDFSKTEAGRMELECIPFDPEQAVVQAAEMISLEAHKKGLEIILDIPPGFSARVKGDPGKFRQIMINLVKNAVKFTLSGEVTVSARWTRHNGKDAVYAAVADTGIGVPEDARAGLFTTFFQADPSNTRRFGGTGLGLAISKNLVDLMGGTIGMIPNTGGGSVFHFTVPLEKTGEPSLEQERDISGARNRRILIVDDRAASRRALRTIFEGLGFPDVDESSFGEEALAAMRGASAGGIPYSICFIDQVMQPMDGWRLAAEINADPAISGAWLVLMAPNGSLGTEAKMTLLRWFQAYIYKPVTRDRLTAVIADFLSSQVPELEAEDAAGQETAEEAERRESGEGPCVSGRLPLVLIAEDSPVNRELFRLFVTKPGYPAITANDGLEALEKAADGAAGIIFMDLQMPRMTGYEAAAELRRRGFKKPVIAVTAGALADERERCLEAGFDDILIKPFKGTDIQRMLEKWTQELPDTAGVPEDGNAANSGVAVFDGKGLIDVFFQEKEMAASMLRRFVRRTEGQIAAALPASIENADWETGRRDAHTIRGTAFQMTGGELGTAAALLENAFLERNRAAAKDALSSLRAAFSRFYDASERFLREESGESGEA